MEWIAAHGLQPRRILPRLAARDSSRVAGIGVLPNDAARVFWVNPVADPMVGPAAERAERICADIRTFGSEALLISRIPGASHCATEGEIIQAIVKERTRLPVLEIEVPPVSDSFLPGLSTRIEALVETARERRKP